jgi:hypothetical protein
MTVRRVIERRMIGNGATAGIETGRRHPERSRSSGGARDLAASAATGKAASVVLLEIGTNGKGTTSVVPLATPNAAALAAEGPLSRFQI